MSLFKTPKVEEAPPPPSVVDEESRRAADLERRRRGKGGRSSTILTQARRTGLPAPGSVKPAAVRPTIMGS